MVRLESDTDLVADGVLMVARHQAQDPGAAREPQGVEILGTPEGALDDHGPAGARFVVEQVVRADYEDSEERCAFRNLPILPLSGEPGKDTNIPFRP